MNISIVDVYHFENRPQRFSVGLSSSHSLQQLRNLKTTHHHIKRHTSCQFNQRVPLIGGEDYLRVEMFILCNYLAREMLGDRDSVISETAINSSSLWEWDKCSLSGKSRARTVFPSGIKSSTISRPERRSTSLSELTDGVEEEE